MAHAATTTLLSSEWLTQEETCKRLGKSVSTVERLAADKTLDSKIEPVPGRKGMRVYRASDVEKFANEHTRQPAVVPARAPQSVQLALPEEILALTRAIVVERESRRALPAPEERTETRPQIAIDKKLWLSLDEAASLSGLARSDLRMLAHTGQLNARKSGGWKIQRRSLEAFAG